jgi:hypothetical protein
MAITYSTTAKNARLDAVAALIDGGAGAGKLEICTAGYASILATITLADPSAAAASGGVLTFSSFPRSDSSADGTGTAAVARFRDSNNVDVITGLTVGLSASDVIIDNTSIVTGQVVTVNSASITHA